MTATWAIGPVRAIVSGLAGLSIAVSSAVLSGPGRATSYLLDPIKEQLIALKQWEMPSPLPSSFFPPSVYSNFPLFHLSLPVFSPCSLPLFPSLPLAL